MGERAGNAPLHEVICMLKLLYGVEVPGFKYDMLIEYLEEIVAENHKVLVFSQFVKMLTIARKYLDSAGIAYEYLDGSTRDRKACVQRFQEEESRRIFLISLKAGGTGLNLTAAGYVIHYDPWWNPAVEAQATDRSHRIGQDKHVFVYKMITKGSVEEKILQLQDRKKGLVDSIITTDAGLFKKLTVEDIEELFS
jgi:non-specific serine/threonine protein kinase